MLKLSNYSLSNYEDLSRVLADYDFKKVAIIGGKRALSAAEGLIRDALKDTDYEVLGSFVYGTEVTMANVKRLKDTKEVRDADVLFAVGGGKALDTVKVLSAELGKKVFTFPTICSNCAGATDIAVVYNEDGSFSHYDTRMDVPSHIFISTKVIAEAPEVYMWAGIGDGISKEAEVRYATEGLDLDTTASLGLAIAKSCEEVFLKYGKKAIEDTRNNIPSEAVERVAVDILVWTGYVSNLTNQEDYYYNSSLAHAFYNATTAIKREGRFEHGEIVSFGVMVIHAYRNSYEDLKRIGEFNKSVGLPIRLEDINIKEEDLETIGKKAVDTTEWQKSEKPLSTKRFIEAIRVADQYGCKLREPVKVK